jgi:hypothetical protein
VLALNACAALVAGSRSASSSRLSAGGFSAHSGEAAPAAPRKWRRFSPRHRWNQAAARVFRSLKKLGSVELAREHDNARAAFARTRSDYDRIRLALVISLPETAFNDESRALELLEPMTRNQHSILNDLAIFIHAFVSEQRRLEQSLQGVQEKLDALKAMERNLIEREKAGQIRR